jgi:uncharacterized membrane protein
MAGTNTLIRLTQQIEGAASLDRVADVLRPLADAVVAEPRRRDLLRGAWLGHALHPLMTDLPIGFWTSAGVLDVLGGRSARPAAQLLTGLGVASALPTALTGWAEYAGLGTQRDRRTASVHAIGNIVASTCYAASWQARRRGRWATGVALGMVGATIASGAGMLGGHLAIAREVSTKSPAFEDGAAVGRETGATGGPADG